MWEIHVRYNNIKYQSFVYVSFALGIHVRYNKRRYQLTIKILVDMLDSHLFSSHTFCSCLYLLLLNIIISSFNFWNCNMCWG